MYRISNSMSVVDVYLRASLRIILTLVLFIPPTSQAENTAEISRFTLQRERTPEADLKTPHTVALPEIEIIEKSGTYNIKIVAVINAPARNVRYVLTDYSHIYRLNPAITESDIIKQDDDGLVHVRTRVKGCAAYFCEELNRVEKVELLPSGDITAEIIPETGQFKSGRSVWRVKEIGDRSEVSYLADMEPDIYIPPVVSKFLVKKAIRQEAQTSLVNLERYSSTLCDSHESAATALSVCN